MGNTYLVPTEIQGPDGLQYMLPGHINWTDTLISPDYPGFPYQGRMVPRDITDVFRYWLLNFIGDAFWGHFGGYIPMSGVSPGDPNIIQFRSGVGTYWMEYGFRVGAQGNQVTGAPPNEGIRAWMSLTDGSRVPNAWPLPLDYAMRNLIFESQDSARVNWARIETGINQAAERVLVEFPGILRLNQPNIFEAVIPDNDSLGRHIDVNTLIGTVVRCNIPQFDNSVPGWGGGWAFSGDVDPAEPGIIRNCLSAYRDNSAPTPQIGYTHNAIDRKPISEDWVGHHVLSFNTTGFPLVFAPRPPGAVISAVDGGVFEIRATGTPPLSWGGPPFVEGDLFPIAISATRRLFYLDNDRAFKPNTIITDIQPRLNDVPVTIYTSDLSAWNWGEGVRSVAGVNPGEEVGTPVPRAECNRPAEVFENRRTTIHMVNIDQFSTDLTFRKLKTQMGNHTSQFDATGNPHGFKDGAYTVHEAWHMWAFRLCNNITLEDIESYYAWSDMFNWSGASVNTTLRNITAKFAGRHMLCPQGYAGIYLEGTGEYKTCHHWMIDIESFVNSRMVDFNIEGNSTTDRISMDESPGGLGFLHFRPGKDTTVAPANLHVLEGSGDQLLLAAPYVGAQHPLNKRDLLKSTNSFPVYTGVLTFDDLGASVTGPNVAPWTYIKRIGAFGVSCTLSKPLLNPITTPTDLVKGQICNFRGFHMQYVKTLQLQIWFDDASCRSDAWFIGHCTEGSPTVTKPLVGPGSGPENTTPGIWIPSRVDGSASPAMINLTSYPGGPAQPRVWCVFSDVFGGPKVGVVSGDWDNFLLNMDSTARVTGDFWFYVDWTESWFSDIWVDDCEGTLPWGGFHGTGGTNQPLMKLDHLTGHVRVRRNRQPARLSNAGQKKEVILGTGAPQKQDYPHYEGGILVGAPARPRQVGTLIDLGPPYSPVGPIPPRSWVESHSWAPGDADWLKEGNYFAGALDSDIADELAHGTWLWDLRASGSGVTQTVAGVDTQIPPIAPRWDLPQSSEVTLTAKVLRTDFVGHVEGTIEFRITDKYGNVLINPNPSAVIEQIGGHSVASVTLEPNTFSSTADPTGVVIVVGALYYGYLNNVTGEAWTPDAHGPGFRSVFLTDPPSFPPVPIHYYPGWQVIYLDIEAPIVATPTTIELEINPDPATTRNLVTVEATVTGENVAYPPSGIIELWDGGLQLVSGSLVGGSRSITRTFAAGLHYFRAVFLGDAYNERSETLEVEFEIFVPPLNDWVLGSVGIK